MYYWFQAGGLWVHASFSSYKDKQEATVGYGTGDELGKTDILIVAHFKIRKGSWVLLDARICDMTVKVKAGQLNKEFKETNPKRDKEIRATVIKEMLQWLNGDDHSAKLLEARKSSLAWSIQNREKELKQTEQAVAQQKRRLRELQQELASL